MTASTTIRLSDFIVRNMEPILQAWEDFAKTIEPPALTMDDTALRDHARQMLSAFALDLTRPQSTREEVDKSQGHGPKKAHDTAAETHAEARLMAGYTVEQLVSEYRALRSSVLRLWADGPAQDLATDMADVARFNEAVDQALAESVARYAKMVKQSQNMFLAILGHDLRNPLGTVTTGATFIMRASEIPPKYVLAATRIFNSGQRMSKLINDLIDFTRTHLGSGLPVKPRKADLAEVCMNVIDEMRTLHAERVIAFDVIGKADAVVDDDRISQVLSNLIGNAIQHGDKRSPIVVQLCATLDDVVITVNNRGDTIDNNTLAGIFEPLVRMNRPSASESNRDTSLGIGLFIAREIVAAHRGRISAESDDSTGTTFTVTLPRLTEAATVAA